MHAMSFDALGEPSRLRIVEHLRNGPSAVGEIAAVLSIRQPQVSKHLSVLAKTGIVACEPFARRRVYHLQEAPFDQIGHWVDSFEQVWDARLDSLGRYLSAPLTRGIGHG